MGRRGPFGLRNVKAGKPSIANRLRLGEVVRYNWNSHVHSLEGRKQNIVRSSVRISDVHHVGRNYHAPGCTSKLPLPDHIRICCVDVRKMRWCSVGSVVFHSFALPRNTEEANGIARTLFTDQGGWVDVLVVRGRCFSSSQACFRANRVLESYIEHTQKHLGKHEICLFLTPQRHCPNPP